MLSPVSKNIFSETNIRSVISTSFLHNVYYKISFLLESVESQQLIFKLDVFEKCTFKIKTVSKILF